MARLDVSSRSTSATQQVKHRDYVYLGLTQSLCPDCRDLVPAKIICRDNRVYFRKNCPTHGVREDFVCSDVARYDMLETSLPAKLPRQVFVEAEHGCPFDCGLCEEHEQHTCVAVVEITDGCNLTCPMCYAGSAPGKRHKSLEQIKAAVDRLVAAEGNAEVIQFSGGEPTLHPYLIEGIEYALTQPIDYVMLNTNGIRLAKDDELLEKLGGFSDRLEIYFQMDSLDDQQVEQLRGEAGLLPQKLRALEKIEAVGLNVTLVATLQGGVNDSAPADLLDFATDKPFITGLSFQPATYSGRHVLPSDLENRITFPDVVDQLVMDDRNDFGQQDFMPLPCAHPNCHWLGLAIRSGGRLLPMNRFVDPAENRDLLANGLSFTREKTRLAAAKLLQRLACGPTCGCNSGGGPAESVGSLPVLDGVDEPADHDFQKVLEFLENAVDKRVGARDVLRITITSFLDAYNFDVRRVMKCCTHHVLPSGHIIPFCAYNVLYRDGKVPLPKLDDVL